MSSTNPDDGKLNIGRNDTDTLVTRWVGWQSRRVITVHVHAPDEKILAAARRHGAQRWRTRRWMINWSERG